MHLKLIANMEGRFVNRPYLFQLDEKSSPAVVSRHNAVNAVYVMREHSVYQVE